MMNTLPPLISSLDEISDRYDGYLIDQWGVLHDGETVFPAALYALERLKQAGKRVIILSNSGRSGEENARLMQEMGIARSLYERVLSAGDDALDALTGERDTAYDHLGRRVWPFTRDDDRVDLLDHGYERAQTVADADFLFVQSMPPLPTPPADWIEQLREGLSHSLPLICANPDLTRVKGAGEVVAAPGAVAEFYSGMGGQSHYHGKPWPRIYKTALKLLDVPAHRVLAIGDSLAHDMRGACGAGIDSLFVVNGIHRERIDLSRPNTLYAELASYPQDRPQAMIADFA
ncbi:TIGR01459 family HAD-type hydrolase [Aquamicrobium segne]|uniref:TIGR01459 family HAD-type hydrolase n=1 Tax=Aquamicrobium segne TaxID=469547 RepID=A0ABW0H225_9HYPH